VLAGQDEELTCLVETALGEAEIESELSKHDRGADFGVLSFLSKKLMTNI
jgi:hypothetical protein